MYLSPFPPSHRLCSQLQEYAAIRWWKQATASDYFCNASNVPALLAEE